ncbi:hypothetical protein J6590_061067 [Homalodisca vitripennis]|nr:hypothetical protein J6590_061067 [Homalodisca vitripennis]
MLPQHSPTCLNTADDGTAADVTGQALTHRYNNKSPDPQPQILTKQWQYNRESRRLIEQSRDNYREISSQKSQMKIIHFSL